MTRIHHFNDILWHVPPTDPADLDLETEAPVDGPGRKFMAQDEGGFFTQLVRVPANFAAPSHSHSHAEVFMVVDGECEFDGTPMSRLDLTVVEAGQPYAFTAGPQGVQFLVVRQAKATFNAEA